MTAAVFLPPAEEEMVAAAQFYEAQCAGLGTDFLKEVHLAVDAIATHPRSGSRIKNEIRRRLLKRFPFGLLYVLEDRTLVILGVMHLRRRPGYWRERVPEQ